MVMRIKFATALHRSTEDTSHLVSLSWSYNIAWCTVMNPFAN